MRQNVIFISLTVLVACIIIVVLQHHFSITEKFQELLLLQDLALLTPQTTHVYLINMKRNPDRLMRFNDQYNNTDLNNVPITRIEGVDGRKLDLNKYVTERAKMEILDAERTGYRTRHYELTRGAVGCYLSHMEVYKTILSGNEEYGIIFEDDARLLRKDMLKSINIAVKALPKDWDILLLGCVCFVCGKYTAYYDVNRFFLLHGYIVKRSSIPKILNFIENDPIEQQIDAKFSDLAGDGLLKIYCLRNKLATQWNMGTTIQTPVKEMHGVNPFEPLT